MGSIHPSQKEVVKYLLIDITTLKQFYWKNTQSKIWKRNGKTRKMLSKWEEDSIFIIYFRSFNKIILSDIFYTTDMLLKKAYRQYFCIHNLMIQVNV